MPSRTARYPTGCLDYVYTTYAMRIAFPADNVCCDYCDFCRAENAGTRFRCFLTCEILPYHNCAPGARCPLDIQNPQKSIVQEETEA